MASSHSSQRGSPLQVNSPIAEEAAGAAVVSIEDIPSRRRHASPTQERSHSREPPRRRRRNLALFVTPDRGRGARERVLPIRPLYHSTADPLGITGAAAAPAAAAPAASSAPANTPHPVRPDHGTSRMDHADELAIRDIIHDMHFKVSKEDLSRIKAEYSTLLKNAKSLFRTEADLEKKKELFNIYNMHQCPSSMPRFGVAFETLAQKSSFWGDGDLDWVFRSGGLEVVIKKIPGKSIREVREAMHSASHALRADADYKTATEHIRMMKELTAYKQFHTSCMAHQLTRSSAFQGRGPDLGECSILWAGEDGAIKQKIMTTYKAIIDKAYSGAVVAEKKALQPLIKLKGIAEKLISHTPDDFIEMKIEEKVRGNLGNGRGKGKGKGSRSTVEYDYNKLADLVETQAFTALPAEKKTEKILEHMTPKNVKSPGPPGAQSHGDKGGEGKGGKNTAEKAKGKGKGKDKGKPLKGKAKDGSQGGKDSETGKAKAKGKGKKGKGKNGKSGKNGGYSSYY